MGLIAARNIKPKHLPNVTVIEASAEGTALIEAWQGADTVFLIDAVQSGAVAGTIHRFDLRVESLPTSFGQPSSHAVSVVEAIEVARALNQLPPRLIVYSIEGKTFENGVSVSIEVIKAARSIVKDVVRYVLSLSQVRGIA